MSHLGCAKRRGFRCMKRLHGALHSLNALSTTPLSGGRWKAGQRKGKTRNLIHFCSLASNGLGRARPFRPWFRNLKAPFRALFPLMFFQFLCCSSGLFFLLINPLSLLAFSFFYDEWENSIQSSNGTEPVSCPPVHPLLPPHKSIVNIFILASTQRSNGFMMRAQFTESKKSFTSISHDLYIFINRKIKCRVKELAATR